MSRAFIALLSAGVLLTFVPTARAVSDPHENMRRMLMDNARAYGFDSDSAVPVLVQVSTPAAEVLEPEESLVNFEYAQMVDRMEKLSRTVIGRDKKKRQINTGVTPADRVDRGEIKHIVIHASGGATGAPSACEGSVAWLLKQKTAAHFMVCRDGRVIRMVRIENIAHHVRNGDIDRSSVGIETESGRPDNRNPFVAADWGPQSYWRMYASVAWLIRAIAKETALPRDRAHILTHEEADRGIPGAHTDPGPYFESGTYQGFDARFPGESVTPREYLMRLVADDVPPQIWMVAASGSTDQVEIRDPNSLGLSHIRVWRQDDAGKVTDLMHEWSAPVAGMPPVSLRVEVPAEAGSYRVVARDLVGNTSAALVRVSGPVREDPPQVTGTRFSLLASAAGSFE